MPRLDGRFVEQRGRGEPRYLEVERWDLLQRFESGCAINKEEVWDIFVDAIIWLEGWREIFGVDRDVIREFRKGAEGELMMKTVLTAHSVAVARGYYAEEMGLPKPAGRQMG